MASHIENYAQRILDEKCMPWDECMRLARLAIKDKRQTFAILKSANLTRPERLAVYSYIVRRDITSTNDLTPAELTEVAGCLFSWDAAGHLDAQMATILRSAA